MTDTPKNDALRKHYYRRLLNIRDNAAFSPADRARALKLLHLDQFEQATKEDNFNFSTTYARISYAAHKFGISGRHIFQERKYRTRKVDTLAPQEMGKHIFTGFRLGIELTRALFGGEVPMEWVGYLDTPYPFNYPRPQVKYTHDFLRVVVVDFDEEEETLTVKEEARPERTYTIPFGAEEVVNKMVAEAIAIVRKISGVPTVLNLINAQLRDGGQLFPEQIVVSPDFLVDVTAVAESFDGQSSFQPWTSLAKRFVPYEQKLPLMRGNLVNYFLDKLVENPDVTFKDLIGTIFQEQPLGLCLYEDNDIRKLLTDLKHHYLSVRKFVTESLDGINVQRENILLEPSFLSPTYGVQGRLDVLQSADQPGGQTTIVELKTSKPWKQNKHKINQTNYIQTLLYDLMVNRALGKGANVRSYILYSLDYDNGLKYAPPEKFQKLEAIAARNKLIGVELLIAKLGMDPEEDLAYATTKLIGKLAPGFFPNLSGFSVKDHALVLEVTAALTDLEKRYFGAYLGFIAREQQISKTGEQGSEAVNGLASLWLDGRDEKMERFELLDGLRFEVYDPSSSTLTLTRPAEDDRLVKFRKGDLIALYTTEGQEARREDTVRSQVHKGSVLSVTARTVELRLRSQQLNDRSYRGDGYWSIEKDILDSSFRNHYRGLFTWATAGEDLKKMWMGLIPPVQKEPLPDPIAETLTDEQNKILQKIIPAEDYFLLWGPPGTGKTSQMLHHLVKHLLDNTSESILLVAYTNRAVDEICESIERIIGPDGKSFTNYIRIGSSLGAGEAFRDRLLSARSAGITRRSELRGMIESTRIFVSTVASVGGKSDLFQLKNFDRIIVDEASQILEPLLCGLLPRAKKALLIGDHKQLPAVVQQAAYGTVVRDGKLRDTGLTSLGNSLFERLYLTAKKNDWHWAYDQLSHQGRMHEDIMAFPAAHFYQGGLSILPDSIPHSTTQRLPLNLSSLSTILSKKLTEKRFLYLPSKRDGDNPDPKVNGHEARMMVELIQTFEALYAATDRPVLPDDIGIITPYRAQIAHIRRELEQAGLNADHYQVDTVERYQGGAKRIVLISLCTNDDRQITTLSQLSEEGVDRKLNVAITRAREHLVVVGCEEVLRQSLVYRALLDHLV
ncbi:ATP-dependent helicase [Neolewinella antarctica]|uniref:DNA replication ATP-dependent helicase Dna2 n=1 Tax=Neolewinella antarctica TaxID=442734 RepID=A0ABX0XBU4_9BACT|nr:AAA domain-containing protein [Neolewinella antarctica]NJC26419.1 DNA replication ATP-dependent helicase Dna2 [Neolewinella antarctica]